MDRFDEEGPSGLYDRDREGRPPKIDEEVEQEIERLLEQNPTERGENATRWTTDRIAEHLDRELGVDVHPETVRDALNRLDYSWTRPRRKLPPVDSEAYRKRLEAIVEAVSQADPDASVLAQGETTIKRFPPLRRQWQPVGEQRPVMVPESNEDFTLYGTLDLTSGATHVRAYEKGRSDYTIQYLESVLEKTTGRVLLIWDQAKWHTSKKVRRWLEKHDRIETHLLPVRSPETNPMEDLWRELFGRVAACLERSLDTLLESAQQYLANLSGKQALRTAGLYSN
ncbi:IS630 family transposase [Salinibacter ruber]|uniref:IS630 family transposase n=1 Tax=Salinibacter ruber TaxID=146919 RepID=UPI00216959E8|nr:IS630 family transposase [Salinibacter ruber]MCS4184944.1 transposase [Salinibacter ruber]